MNTVACQITVLLYYNNGYHITESHSIEQEMKMTLRYTRLHKAIYSLSQHMTTYSNVKCTHRITVNSMAHLINARHSNIHRILVHQALSLNSPVQHRPLTVLYGIGP